MEIMRPMEIENKSFEIISRELGDRVLDKKCEPVIKRVIHTTADFEYADSLVFSEGVIEKSVEILKAGACIVTDTQMAMAGINKAAVARCGCEVVCFMSNSEVADQALAEGTTRAAISMRKAAEIEKPLVIVVGNAPTALIELNNLINEGKVKPKLIVGVPVGFVNVVESKELIIKRNIPSIVARGRKGGSNVAAAIVNALLYMASPRDINQ